MAVCMYCEEKVNPHSPEVVGFRHDPDRQCAHLRCYNEATRQREAQDLREENTALRAQLSKLEAKLAAAQHQTEPPPLRRYVVRITADGTERKGNP